MYCLSVFESFVIKKNFDILFEINFKKNKIIKINNDIFSASLKYSLERSIKTYSAVQNLLNMLDLKPLTQAFK